MRLDKLTWQLVDPESDGWFLGTLIRGLVRNCVAQVYFDDEKDDRRGGWWWRVLVATNGLTGVAPNLESAIVAAEAAIEAMQEEYSRC
jgi:hypothetical protein